MTEHATTLTFLARLLALGRPTLPSARNTPAPLHTSWPASEGKPSTNVKAGREAAPRGRRACQRAPKPTPALARAPGGPARALCDHITRLHRARTCRAAGPRRSCLPFGRSEAESPCSRAGSGRARARPLPRTASAADRSPGRRPHHPVPAGRAWDDWVEWDSKAWPRKVARRYTLVPTVCFNCESGCGLLAYVDKDTFEVRKFEGNPAHPGSRGRNCAKGPATHNQTYDPERILYPLKRVGARGEGKWKRVAGTRPSRTSPPRCGLRARSAATASSTTWAGPAKTTSPTAPSRLGRRRPQQPHQHLLGRGARRLPPLVGQRQAEPRLRQRAGDAPRLRHLESGHYFNPHAQRIMEGKRDGAKLIVLDPRLSNTAAQADVWLRPGPAAKRRCSSPSPPPHPERLYDADFVRRWVNWEETLAAAAKFAVDEDVRAIGRRPPARGGGGKRFEDFDRLLRPSTTNSPSSARPKKRRCPSRASRSRRRRRPRGQSPRGPHLAQRHHRQPGRLAGRPRPLLPERAHGQRGHRRRHGAQRHNKFVPKAFSTPPPFDAWNELHMPHEWPFAMYEMSFCLPHFLEEGRGAIDVYFTRVYNPMWINPDGFMWLEALRDEKKIGSTSPSRRPGTRAPGSPTTSCPWATRASATT